MDDDYETALMWQTEQDLACPGCGQPKDEVWIFSPDEQGEKEARWRSVLRKCAACSHLDFRVEQHNGNDHRDKHGIWPTLERMEDG